MPDDSGRRGVYFIKFLNTREKGKDLEFTSQYREKKKQEKE